MVCTYNRAFCVALEDARKTCRYDGKTLGAAAHLYISKAILGGLFGVRPEAGAGARTLGDDDTISASGYTRKNYAQLEEARSKALEWDTDITKWQLFREEEAAKAMTVLREILEILCSDHSSRLIKHGARFFEEEAPESGSGAEDDDSEFDSDSGSEKGDAGDDDSNGGGEVRDGCDSSKRLESDLQLGTDPPQNKRRRSVDGDQSLGSVSESGDSDIWTSPFCEGFSKPALPGSTDLPPRTRSLPNSSTGKCKRPPFESELNINSDNGSGDRVDLATSTSPGFHFDLTTTTSPPVRLVLDLDLDAIRRQSAPDGTPIRPVPVSDTHWREELQAATSHVEDRTAKQAGRTANEAGHVQLLLSSLPNFVEMIKHGPPTAHLDPNWKTDFDVNAAVRCLPLCTLFDLWIRW